MMKKVASLLLGMLLVLGLMPRISYAAVDSNSKDFQQYLQEVSKTRGWDTTLTVDQFNTYLKKYSQLDDGIKGFDNIADLRNYLGEVIKPDYSNLKDVNSSYGVDAVKFLKQHNDSIDNYLYVDDVDFAIANYQGLSSNQPPFNPQDMEKFMEENLGLTAQETQALSKHMEALAPELSTPENQARLQQIADEMMTFKDFKSPKDLTAAQVTEFLSLVKELKGMLKLSGKIYLVDQSGKKSKISFKDLMFMDQPPANTSLLIELYDSQTGTFLADLLLKPDMIGSKIIKDTGKEIGKVSQTVKTVKTAPRIRTVKGGKLPKTASNGLENALLGLGAMAAGLVIWRRTKTA